MIQTDDIAVRVGEYHDWLKRKTTLSSLGSGWTEITTPFLNRHNDHIQIYARRDDLHYELNDDGETLRDLEMSGCKVDSPRRKSLLQTTLNGFGVELHDDVLLVKATAQTFPMRKHSLVQAISAVNDMFSLSVASVANFFKEDVALWLEQENIRSLSDVQFLGKSGFQHRFDFAVPHSKAAPERLIRTINRPTKDSALGFIVAWNDTYEQRPSESSAIAILNDNEQSVSPTVVDALRQYSIESLLWSKRSLKIELLAA